MQIHERIKYERLKAGLTEEQMAVKMGVKRSTYQYWETKTPHVDKVKLIAEALGLPVNYFFVNINEGKDELFGKPAMVGKSKDGQIVYVEAHNLTASYERIIEEKERVINLIQSQVEKAEKDKDRLFKALEDAQKTINEVLKPIKEQTGEILTNSKKTQEGVHSLKTEIVAEHGEMMETLDQIAGNEPGTTAARAGTVEIGHRLQKIQTGKKANMGKKS